MNVELDEWIFGIQKSHGIVVAKVARLPQKVIDMAKERFQLLSSQKENFMETVKREEGIQSFLKAMKK